jgi:hypothetical protein
VREYHKIDSVFKRDPATNFKTFLMGDYAREEFGALADISWKWSEKIDGTNVRVMWDGERVRFGGRTDDAQMPATLTQALADMFPTEKMLTVFGDKGGITLYGEGYGAKIQKGGGDYIPNGQSFILFDVFGGDVPFQSWDVETYAGQLGIKCAPIVGRGTLAEAIEFTAAGFKSTVAAVVRDAEGIVLRPPVELSDRFGHRIITKLKAKDFAAVAKAVAA